jgi:D-amino-acid oxidase
MRTRPEILVIGAGVSGLTTAVCLAEAGPRVRVRTRELPGETTSCAAGAIWGPYFTTDDRVPQWSERTRIIFDALAGVPGAGVRLVHGIEAGRGATAPPDWARAMAGFRRCATQDLPEGFASGWEYTAPVVDMPAYLAYLVERLRDAGGELEVGMVGSLEDAVAAAPVTVNCTGIGAATLVPDRQVFPNRGQLVVVDNPGVSTFFIEHDESPTPTYFLPHGPDRVVLGGSAELGRSDLAPDYETSKAIQRRCATIEPLLAHLPVREHRVGLRPSRPRVRLERVAVGRGQVIHNYGHGGSGVTLSWGCARDVLALVMDCLA